mmetsp:Transcript_3741/g.7818  ORF Transcript_3741/g.7818 Transcript_3741/m.7818 type:complete len:237 (-) Transcript_3741:455-1165(-)
MPFSVADFFFFFFFFFFARTVPPLVLTPSTIASSSAAAISATCSLRFHSASLKLSVWFLCISSANSISSTHSRSFSNLPPLSSPSLPPLRFSFALSMHERQTSTSDSDGQQCSRALQISKCSFPAPTPNSSIRMIPTRLPPAATPRAFIPAVFLISQARYCSVTAAAAPVSPPPAPSCRDRVSTAYFTIPPPSLAHAIIIGVSPKSFRAVHPLSPDGNAAPSSSALQHSTDPLHAT